MKGPVVLAILASGVWAVPALAQSQPMSLYADGDLFGPGDVVRLHGAVDDGTSGRPVGVEVTDESGAVILIRTATTHDGGEFEMEFRIPPDAEGTLAITASAATQNGPASAATVVEVAVPQQPPPESPASQVGDTEPGGGCLVATAAHGTELAPHVQRLREVRDTAVTGTASGAAFMGTFGQLYYSFSPAVADLEREHPAAREAARAALAPLMVALSPLEDSGIGSEAEMVVYGMAALALAAGAYGGIPAAVLGLYRHRGRLPATGPKRVFMAPGARRTQ